MKDTTNAVTRPHDEGRTVPGVKRRGERLAGLLVAGIVLLNFPLLSIFNVPRLFLGVPVLFVYLFSVWVLLIGVMVLIHRERPTRTPAGGREAKDQDHA
jgi:drug/metabolite transporter (DMT)-like permease